VYTERTPSPNQRSAEFSPLVEAGELSEERLQSVLTAEAGHTQSILNLRAELEEILEHLK
jgi:hypothetical protein